MRTFILGLALSAAIAGPASAAELLTNGNFETGTYAGWSTNALPGSNGNLSISTPGANVPIGFGQGTAGNASGGNFYSVTGQTGPGGYALIQSFTVPNAATAISLSFQMFVNSYGGLAIDPAGLTLNAGPNEHARVDILTAGASAFSTNPADILANFYLGIDTGSNPNPYTSYAFNLSSLLTAGQTYQIRFAQVDNLGFFNQGVDNVSILTNAVPEPASWALMIAGFGLVGGAMRRRSTKVAFA